MGGSPLPAPTVVPQLAADGVSFDRGGLAGSVRATPAGSWSEAGLLEGPDAARGFSPGQEAKLQELLRSWSPGGPGRAAREEQPA